MEGAEPQPANSNATRVTLPDRVFTRPPYESR